MPYCRDCGTELDEDKRCPECEPAEAEPGAEEEAGAQIEEAPAAESDAAEQSDTDEVPDAGPPGKKKGRGGRTILVLALVALLGGCFLCCAGTLVYQYLFKVEVPYLGQMTPTDAESLLEAKGFVPRMGAEDYSDYADAGLIYYQQPDGGTRARPGSVVVYDVSMGESAVVPGLVGMTKSAATGQLSELGLEYAITEREDSDNVGKVIEQDPGQSEKVAKGSTVELVVGKAKSQPAPTPTPKPVVTTPPINEANLKAAVEEAVRDETELSGRYTYTVQWAKDPASGYVYAAALVTPASTSQDQFMVLLRSAGASWQTVDIGTAIEESIPTGLEMYLIPGFRGE